MKQRAYERIGTNLPSNFSRNDSEYFGIVTNLSENGMCFKTVMDIPAESIPPGSGLNISIHLHQEKVEIPVKVIRIAKSGGFCDTMGVELLYQPPSYLEFIKKIKSYMSP